MKVEIPNHLLVKVSGLVSRGIKAAEINEDGILIFTLTDGTKIELGSVKGDPGPRGESGVYVGTGEMPEDCNVQIDPSGEAFEFIQPPKTANVGQALLVKSVDENGKPTEWETGEVQAGSGGTSDHKKLSNRDAADQHPIAAITGLEEALAGKQPTGNYLTNEALAGAVDDALAQAKASGEFDGADGKTAYQYAQDGGYTGTEAEFAEKLAAEIPAIDNTLSKAGKAADAAKVGEEIRSLSGKIVTTSESKVSAHNTGTDAHSDIRILIQGLTDRLNALADSDDTTLDQLSEVVAYIKENRELIASITTDKVSVSDIIDNLTTNVSNKPLSAAQGVALKALIDGIVIPDKLPNPNALTFSGAVTGSYDGSAPLSVEIPSGGGGSSGGSGKAKSQILIDQEITELTASLSVTLEHDFHNLTAIINCGSAGAALTAGSDGTAVASKIGLMIDTTSFSYNSRKVAYVDTTTKTWQTRMIGAEWSDDLSIFKHGFTVEIATAVGNTYYCFPFGGSSAMYGTLGTEDNAPRTGKTANIVVNGAYLNVGTRVVLWGEYYE